MAITGPILLLHSHCNRIAKRALIQRIYNLFKGIPEIHIDILFVRIII